MHRHSYVPTNTRAYAQTRRVGLQGDLQFEYHTLYLTLGDRKVGAVVAVIVLICCGVRGVILFLILTVIQHPCYLTPAYF